MKYAEIIPETILVNKYEYYIRNFTRKYTGTIPETKLVNTSIILETLPGNIQELHQKFYQDIDQALNGPENLLSEYLPGDEGLDLDFLDPELEHLNNI